MRSGDFSIGAALASTEFARIMAIESLFPLYQPIVHVGRQEIFGYEGLIRGPAGSLLHPPAKLFAAAEHSGGLLDLDYLCRKVIIAQFARLALPGRLFINVNPAVLMAPGFRRGLTTRYLNGAGIAPQRVVIEITETQPVGDYRCIQEAVDHYRGEGFQIAIDDLGAGYSGLKLWSELRPDFVKIDRHFVAGVDENKANRQFVSSILEISRTLNCQTIAEGVETEGEYRALRKLGADYLQGYYFAKPAAMPGTVVDQDRFRNSARRHTSNAGNTAAKLIKPMPSVDSICSVEVAADIFLRAPAVQSIAVLIDQAPVGLLLRNNFMNLCAHRYGRELYHRKPVYRFMEKNFLAVDIATPLEVLSKRLTAAIDIYVDEFVLLERGRFAGKGTLLDLLKRITDQQLSVARHANPLTSLPGNVPIAEVLSQLLANKNEFVAAYCDLDNFKPFNDHYGYARGDEAILLLADVLKRHAGERDFVGHIGGDDFLVFFRRQDWQQHCEAILTEFAQEMLPRYGIEDQRRGYVEALDRQQTPCRYPLVSLSIGALAVGPGSYPVCAERINRTLAQAKTAAKRSPGNALATFTLTAMEPGVTEWSSSSEQSGCCGDGRCEGATR